MPTTNVTFAAREQVFNINVTGLMPLTTHYVYFERNLVDSLKIKPQGQSLGNHVITDASGMATFDFLYDSGLPLATTPYEDAQQAQATVIGKKEVVVVTSNTSTLSSSFRDSALSYAVTIINVDVIYN